MGSPENILLQNRNEKTALIVSYRDIKKQIGETFSEVVSKQAQFENKGPGATNQK